MVLLYYVGMFEHVWDMGWSAESQRRTLNVHLLSVGYFSAGVTPTSLIMPSFASSMRLYNAITDQTSLMPQMLKVTRPASAIVAPPLQAAPT